MVQRLLRSFSMLALVSMMLGGLPPAMLSRALAAPAKKAVVAGPERDLSPTPVPATISSSPVPHPEPPPPNLPAHAPIIDNTLPDLGKLPLAFVPNVGQLDARVRYTTRDTNANVFFTNQDITLAVPFAKHSALIGDNLSHRSITATQTLSMSVVRLNYVGAGAQDVIADTSLPGRVHFLKGNNRSDWHTNIPTYAGITYQQLYQGIDLRFDGAQGKLKSTYTIAPKADPTRLRWRYVGAKDVRLDTSGDLLILLEKPGFAQIHSSDVYTITEKAPNAWQMIQGRRIPVSVGFQIGAANTISFQIGIYNTAYALIIDPTIVYSRLLQGSTNDIINDLAVDSSGNVYVTGTTSSTDFPKTLGVVQPDCNVNNGASCDDAFVTKLTSTGTISYSTFFGGEGADTGYGIAVSNDNHPYITGYSSSLHFPYKLSNAYSTTGTTFIVKFAVDGHDTDYSSAFNAEDGFDIAVDTSGAAYIVGDALSGLPPRHAIYTYSADNDAYVAKFNPNLTGDSSLVYSTYLSGNEYDIAYGIVVDGSGTAFVCGSSSSLDFPTTSNALQKSNQSNIYDSIHHYSDAFISKLTYNSQNGTLTNTYTTFLGGSGPDAAMGIAIDASGKIYITGDTGAATYGGVNNFPTTPTPGVWDDSYAGGGMNLSHGSDAFAAKISPLGLANDLVYSGFFGDIGTEYSGGIAVNPTTGAATIVGSSFINAIQDEDAYVTTIAPDGSKLDLTKYIGGTYTDRAKAVGIDGSGNIYVAGYTNSPDFPTQPPTAITNTNDKAFIVKLGQGDSLMPEQARGPEECLDCAIHNVVANWFTYWPVNTRTGNFWTNVTDIAVQSPGPALAWSRSYASQATEDLTTTLGFGWQHPYSARLILPTTTGGDVTVLSGRGNQLRFVDTGNGTYQANAGIYSSLVRASGLYTQTLRDQSQLVFSATTGQLVSMRDALGRALTLTYSGTPARLTQIADANDSTRKLTLTYYASGRINTVSDGTRTVTYAYDATTGDLTSVQDVRGQTTQYTYTNHLLTRITDPLGQAVEQMVYTGLGNTSKVTNQTLQSGEQIQFSYLSATTVMTTTGVDGRRDVQKIAYGDDNAMTGMTINGQSVLSSGFDTSFSPASVTDGNSKTTTTSYSSNGLPLQRTNALNQATRFQYASNRPTLVTDTLGIVTSYNYDALGNLLKTTAGITTTSSIRATTIYTYSYLTASNVWTSLTQPLTTPLPKDSRLLEQSGPDGVVTHYDYDSAKAHQVIKMTVGFGTALAQATTYGYDALGRVTSTTTAFGTTLARTDTTTYNPDNTIAQTIQNYKDGIFTSANPDEDISTTYGYDVIGRQIWVKDVLGHYDVTHYNVKGQVDWTTRNMSGYSGGTLPATPPVYSPSTTDANVATFYGYDGLGRTTLVTETGILTGTFNTSLLQFSAATNRVTRTEYDQLSRPVTVTLNYRPGLPQTVDTNIALYTRYDGASNVITQTDALGRWTVNQYDALNRPIKVIANYQDGNPLTGPRDADIVTVTTYDAAGRTDRTIDNWVDGTFSVTEPITDRVTLYQYDNLSRVKTTTVNYAPGNSAPELNRTSTTAYDAVTGRVIGQQDPLGRWVNTQYDVLGRTIKTIQNCTNGSGTPVNPATTACAAFSASLADRNIPTQQTYDTLNRVTDTTNALNIASHTDYDGQGRTTRQVRNYKDGTFLATKPDEDVSTSYTYDALGRTLTATDVVTTGVTAVTSYSVNNLGQTVSTTDPLGRVVLNGYDGSGTLRWSKRPAGQITVYKMDGLGRTTATIVNYMDGVVGASEPADTDLTSKTVLDKAGRALQTIDPAGRITAFAYDNLDRLIGVTENQASGTCPNQPCNVITQYQYDRVGNRTAIIDPRGYVRRFTYDAASQQKSASDALNNTTSWQYDAGGRRTAQTDPRGTNYNLTFGYDSVDRLKTTSATTLGTITQNYDALGRRTSLVDGTGTTSVNFDALGRISNVSAPNTGIVQYAYNGRGDRVQLTYPTTNTTLRYAYNNDGRLSNVKQSSITNPVASYNYDPVGRLVQAVTNANATSNSQLVTNYRYDGADRMIRQRTSEAGTAIGGFDYQLNRNGLRTLITETLPLSPTLSTTRIKTMSFEGASLTDAATGADSISPAAAPTVALETNSPIKGAYSATIANLGATYLREDFTAAADVYVTFYMRLNAVPTSNTRIVQLSALGTTIGELLVTTAGKLRLRNNGTNVGLDSATLTVGSIYRVGVHQKSGSGTGVLEAFMAAGDAQFTSAFAASSALTISGSADRANIGPTSGTNPMNITLDEITFDTAGLAGPVLSSAQTTSSANTATNTSLAPLASPAAADISGQAGIVKGRLPIAFIPNAGQNDASVRFQARGIGGNLFYGSNELTLALRTPTRDKKPQGNGNGRQRKPKNIPPTVVQQRWIGAHPTAVMTGTLDLPGKANFYLDNNPANWRTNLPMYAGTLTSQLYDGIDLYTQGVDGQLKNTYVVAAGADPTQIRWRYQGHSSVQLDTRGNLVVNLPAPASTLTDTEVLSSTLTELAPIASQTINEREVAVPARFNIGPDGSVSIALGAYDHTQPLIIDPTLIYSTYLGGSGSDIGNSIALDTAGNMYITGSTSSSSSSFPAQGTLGGPSDAFVTKFNATGSAYLYSTFLGGSLPTSGGGSESGIRIAVDSANNAYIGGFTSSTNFPVTTATARQTTAGGADDGFVAKLSPTGTLLYASYFGGSGDDYVEGLALNSTSKVVVSGQTYSSASTFPLKSAKQSTYGGAVDAFLAEFDMSLSGTNSLVFSTYLGGNAMDDGLGVAVDSSDAMYVGGTTASPNFPYTAGAYRTTCNGTSCQDAFVTKFTWNGTTLAHSYSTYLGGSGAEQWTGTIVVDKQNQAIRIGSTDSTDVIPNALQSSNGGGTDTFVSKLNSAGTALVYNTYLGGSGDEVPYDATLDSQGVISIIGDTTSTNFPTNDPLQATNGDAGAAQDVYITQINPAIAGAAGLQMSTYFGGSNYDYSGGIAVDATFTLAVTGGTASSNLPTSSPFRSSNAGGNDVFVAKLAISGRTLRHTYDGLQRLIGTVESPGNTYTYGYDLAGNRTSVQLNGGTPIVTTYNGANRITNAGYTYDNAGNLTNDGTTAYTYDALNRMLTRGGTTTYASNGDGTLVSQTANSITTRYTQDLASPLTQILQTQVGAAPRTDSLFALGRIATLQGSTRTWYVNDALGSVRRTVSDAGVPQGVINYDPWGTPESGTVPTFGFTGELQDTTTGLVNLRARWYSTAQGKFTSVDPFAGAAEQPYSQNPYQYAYADPVLLTDASGEQVVPENGGGVGRTACLSLGYMWSHGHCVRGGERPSQYGRAARLQVVNKSNPWLDHSPCLPELQIEVWVGGKRICVLNTYYLGKHGELDPTFVQWIKKCEAQKPLLITLPNGTIVMASEDREDEAESSSNGPTSNSPLGGSPSDLRRIANKEVYEVTDGRYYFEARLDRYGRLTLNVKTKINGQYGRIFAGEEFQNALKNFENFGRSIYTIRGRWDGMADGLGDNLATFNQLTGTGVPEELAALKTWTGQQASQAGYGRVKIVLLEGSPGHYTQVVVDFE